MRSNMAVHFEDQDRDLEAEDLDETEPEERAALLASIDLGLEQAARGEGRDAREFLAEIRERRVRVSHR
jgi:hypothetical protein